MFEKNNRYKILKIFLDCPLESFRLREIARLTKISPASVLNYLKEFAEKGLIEKYEKRGIPFYKAIRDNEDFKQYKKLSILFELHKSGLIDYLWDKLAPDTIILYGSFAKGEGTENSDIDLFIQAPEKKISLEKYEKQFGREINIFFDEEFSRLSNELKNNLLNGIVLKGYIKVF